MSENEIYTILSRFGDNCKMYLCGDGGQDDLTSKRYNEYSGFNYIISVLRKINTVEMIEFNVEDVVRSGFVKQLIKAKIAVDCNIDCVEEMKIIQIYS